MLEQFVDAAHDQVDAGRLQGLDKARRETQRDTVTVPEQSAPTGDESQQARIRDRLADRRLYTVTRAPILEVGAGVHIAVADTMLQRDSPAPAGRPRIGLGVWGTRRGQF